MLQEQANRREGEYVVVLDRDLPGVHGDEICRRLAAGRSPSRILMLTAAGGLSDRVEGLNLGADDYLAKPFGFAELTARVRANASHELRTPLTAGRALLEVAIADPEPTVETLRATCEELVELSDQQERLIAALLTSAAHQRNY
jgi:DNA-binding response OmpR family regulator